MEIIQYHVYLINLDPTVGHEITKTRPCLVISPDDLNTHLKTIMIAPMTTKSHNYPTRVPLHFAGKSAFIVLDQIRTVDRMRFIKEVGKLDAGYIRKVKGVIKEMLVD